MAVAQPREGLQTTHAASTWTVAWSWSLKHTFIDIRGATTCGFDGRRTIAGRRASSCPPTASELSRATPAEPHKDAPDPEVDAPQGDWCADNPPTLEEVQCGYRVEEALTPFHVDGDIEATDDTYAGDSLFFALMGNAEETINALSGTVAVVVSVFHSRVGVGNK